MADPSTRRLRAALFGRLAISAGVGLALAACQTSSGYQEAKGELPSAKPMAKPAFPTRETPASTPAPTPTPPPAVVATAPPPPPTAAPPVESRPLPPPAAKLVAVAVAPVAPPPAPAPAAAKPATMAPTSPPATIPPPRPNATGNVIQAAGSGGGSTYTVKHGQGLDAIGREVGVSRQALIDLNGLSAPYALRPGQILKTSSTGGGSSGPAVYVVNAGDTLFSISRRFDSTPAEMAELNGFKVSDPVRPGQHLTLPKKFQSAQVVAQTAPSLRPAVAPPSAPPAQPARVASSGPPPAVSAPARPPPTTVPAPSTSAEPVRTSPAQAAASSTPPAPTTIARAAPPPSPAVSAPAPAGPPIERTTASAAQVKAAGAGKFVWPVKGRILSGFGPKSDGQRNDGINIAAPMNASVHAAAAGEVIYAGDVLREYGNLVLIQHADGFVTAYGHLAKMNVKMKDKVSQDQEIGQVGESGGVTQPQLHFETRYARTAADSPAPPVDPLLVLPSP